MVGVTLSGTDLAAEIKADLKAKVEQLQNNDPSFKPCLVIVQVISADLFRKAQQFFYVVIRWGVARTVMSTSG